MGIDIVYTNGGDPDFVALCEKLDRHLSGLEGENYQEDYRQYNGLDDIEDAFVAYADGKPAGCVSFKRHQSTGAAELKRMFVLDECRGKGVARLLLAAVEEKAAEKGYAVLILETGKHLTSAQNLYRNAGFTVFPNYDQYVDMPNSICMRKAIGG